MRRKSRESRGVSTRGSSRSMSAGDAAFLNIERKEIPLHIASVCIFDGPSIVWQKSSPASRWLEKFLWGRLFLLPWVASHEKLGRHR